MKSGKRSVGLHVASLLSALCSIKAHAITIDFTVYQTTAVGAYAAGGYSGYFSFDDSLVTPATTLGISTSPETGPAFLGLPTFDLEFNWLGQTWDESNSGLGRLTFDASGQLTNWLFGGLANTCPPPYDRTAAALGYVSGLATVPTTLCLWGPPRR